MSSYFARFSWPVCVGLVRVPSSQISCEDSALAFRFRLDCSLQPTCRRCTGSGRSATHRPVVECTCMGRSRTCGSQVVRCRSRTSGTTSSVLVLIRIGFSSINIRGEIPPPSSRSLPIGTRCHEDFRQRCENRVERKKSRRCNVHLTRVR